MSRFPGITWPFRTRHAEDNDPDDFEPTDAQLGGAVTDPFDSPSYTSCITNQAGFDAMAARMFPSTKGNTK